MSADVVIAVEIAVGVAVGVAVGIAVGVFFATASLVNSKVNSDFVGAGLGSRWMLPIVLMSSLGNARVAWPLSASGLVLLVVCWLLVLWLVQLLVCWPDFA